MALVLTQDGVPRWTIALDEKIKVGGGGSTDEDGMIELSEVSMKETDPLILERTAEYD